MPLENVYYISQIAAACAIATSLLFVGLQLRQNDRTQRAIMHQMVVQRTIETAKFYYTPEHAAVFAKMMTVDRAFTAAEVMVAVGILRINVMNLEDVLWQQKHGLLAEDAVQSAIASSRRMFATPGARLAFRFFSDVYSPGQLALIEGLVLKDNPVQLVSELSETWAAWATEMFPEA
jgi:hypothetical protein